MKHIIAFAFASILATAAGLASAAEVAYDHAQFAAARAAGKPVALVFHADWCPVCRAQAPVLKELAATPDLQPLTLFVADFDTEKDLKKSLGVVRQSTVVVFKDGAEVARSTGSVGRQALEPLLRKALR